MLIAAAGWVVVAATHGPAAGMWWGWDDLHYLITILQTSPVDYLFDPGHWRGSPILFTPLNILPYEINHYLFGLDPWGFYLHQLLAAWALFVATVLFLRLWCPDLWAVAGASLACISAPVLITVYQIMCVHYLEGLLFCVLAVYFFVLSLRKEELYWALPGAAFYLLACAAKEIYIPLVGVLLFWPEKTFKMRLRNWTVYLLAFAIYFLWRYLMLGTLVSGYGMPLLLSDVAKVPLVAVTSILGGDLQGVAGGMVFLALLAGALVRRRLSPLFLAVLLAALMAPLLPIGFRLRTVDRAQVLIAWVICISLVLLLERLSRNGRAAAGFSAVLLLALSTGVVRMSFATREQLIRENQRYRIVGEYVLRERESHALLLTGNGYRVREAKRLRRLLREQEGPELLYDPMQIAALGKRYVTIHWFDPKANRLVDITGPDPAFMQSWARHTVQRPLSLSIEKRDGVVHWQFGPYRDSNYDVIYLSAPFAFTDARHVGRYPAPIPAMDFVLRYQSAEGWVTYSDVLHWDSAEGELLSWSRPAG